MKKFIMYCSLMTILLFIGCQKDLYEIPSQQSVQKVEGTTRYVSIKDVLFLKPQIEKFKNNVESRAIDSLELDTEHIVEYLHTNGFKSYSILVKKDSTQIKEHYFENLHIVKDANSSLYDSFLVKYIPENDSKINFANYTGALEFYNEDKILTGTLYVENSTLKDLEPAPPSGGNDMSGSGGSDNPDCDCGPSLVSQFFDFLSNTLGGLGTSINNFLLI